MTLKKYAIVYFIILLLNLAVVNVVIAQGGEEGGSGNTTVSPSPTTGSSKPSITITSTSINSPEPTGSSGESGPEACLNTDPCTSANETLKLCSGIIKPPSEYIEEGTKNGTYKPEPGLNKCMCNLPYYDSLTACIQCFANATQEPFGVQALDQYKAQCKNLGTTFTDTMPDIPPQGATGIPKKMKIGIVVGIFVVIFSLIGIAILKYTRKKRRVAEQSAFASKLSAEIHESGNRLSTGDILTETYPPPASPSARYPPPPPPTEYPPPSEMGTMNIPTPQPSSTTYYPPPSEYRSPHGGQSGESDSYFDGKF